jgi:hypothetical protein
MGKIRHTQMTWKCILLCDKDRGEKWNCVGGEKVAIIIAVVCVLGVGLQFCGVRVKTYLKVHFRDVHSSVSKVASTT